MRLTHDARQRQQRRKLRCIAAGGGSNNRLKLFQIATQNRFVQAVVVRSRLATYLHVDIDGAPTDLPPNERFDMRFQRRIALGQPQIQLEVTIVDRSDFGGDG